MRVVLDTNILVRAAGDEQGLATGSRRDCGGARAPLENSYQLCGKLKTGTADRGSPCEERRHQWPR
jgi:hypothetical protein